MSRITDFYSTKEASKPADKRLYHNNSACKFAKEIPPEDRQIGVGGYRNCEECARMSRAGL